MLRSLEPFIQPRIAGDRIPFFFTSQTQWADPSVQAAFWDLVTIPAFLDLGRSSPVPGHYRRRGVVPDRDDQLGIEAF
jgi:hypothetical protein